MARPSEEFLLAWEALSGNATGSGWQAIVLSSAGPIDVHAGRRSPDGAEAILLDFPSVRLAPAEKLPEGQGFAVERADTKDASQLRLALTRSTASNAELFTAMACDVVGALDEAAATGMSETRLQRVFLGRVATWQEFMRKGSQALGAEAEIGLVGELMLLRTIIGAGVPPTAAIESWVGPLDGLQDFLLGTGALEVKTTLSTVGFPVRITSLQQLDDSTRQPLFLVGVRLRQVDGGQSLTDLVAMMREAVKENAQAMRLLNERLVAADWFDVHAERYIRRFLLVDMRVIQVKEDFPKLTLGTVPTGITWVTYEIDLDKASGERIPVAEALKKLRMT